ncbi:nuclear transport factor 2 family protein [Nonomuraea sp. NPDC000554]|uniref:nuclear transport factor 2 family protein n=1 Tax=Nonomuraea sp. NPDC000554 TaxID=3154259 RepID=UPI00332DD8D5
MTASDQGTGQEIERIFHAWDEALGARDLDAALALYAPDAVLESPLIRHHLGVDDGIRQGHEQLREFIQVVFDRQPPQRKRFRTDYFTDGRTLIWEYPRSAPDGDQMDLVEVMEIADGLIQRHRVYWGWFGLRLLETDHQ